MSVLIPSMSLALAESIASPTPRALVLQSSAPSADTEARRLTRGVARGDEAAFQELYDLYHQRLFRFALALARGDELLARETVQSVFLTAASKLRSVESEAHLWNWLARVARQQVAKSRRQRQRDPIISAEVELSDCADPGQLDSVLEEKLDAALLSIGTEERQLIEWFYFDGLSHNDIAAQLNVTGKAVSSRLERVRAKLRSLVTGRFSDAS